MVSLAVGAVLGALLASAPRVFGPTALTDPAALGALLFTRPRPETILIPLLHLSIGVGIGVLGRLAPLIEARAVVLAAVAVSGAATLLESGYGAGVMGVGWWAIGSAISAGLMLIGAKLVHRLATGISATGEPRRLELWALGLAFGALSIPLAYVFVPSGFLVAFGAVWAWVVLRTFDNCATFDLRPSGSCEMPNFTLDLAVPLLTTAAGVLLTLLTFAGNSPKRGVARQPGA